MKYFWDTVGTIEKGVGFAQYDLCHILWLLFFVTLAAVCCLCYRKCDPEKRRNFRYAMAALLVADEVFKQVCLQIGDRFTFSYLPLHLCSINIFLIVIHAIRPSKLLGNFLYTVSIPAAIAALVFPAWTALPFGNFMHMHSFTVHILLALYPIVLTAGGDIRPDLRVLPKILLMMGGFAVFALCVNLALDTNFMYLMYPPKGNPLVWFEKTFGNHLIGYPVLIALVLFVMYGSAACLARRKTKRRMAKEEVKV